jgi:hypothetical protein
LQHVYANIRGDWTPALEQQFQELRALEPTLLVYQNDAAKRAELRRGAPAQNWEAAWKRYEGLRFARLCHYLRIRPVDASIGYSILIFRLDASEISGATGGSIQQWRSLIEQGFAARRATARITSPIFPPSSEPGG